jgi:hypothetical protein
MNLEKVKNVLYGNDIIFLLLIEKNKLQWWHWVIWTLELTGAEFAGLYCI